VQALVSGLAQQMTEANTQPRRTVESRKLIFQSSVLERRGSFVAICPA